MKRRSFFKAIGSLLGVAVLVPESLGKVIEELCCDQTLLNIMDQAWLGVFNKHFPELLHPHSAISPNLIEVTARASETPNDILYVKDGCIYLIAENDFSLYHNI